MEKITKEALIEAYNMIKRGQSLIKEISPLIYERAIMKLSTMDVKVFYQYSLESIQYQNNKFIITISDDNSDYVDYISIELTIDEIFMNEKDFQKIINIGIKNKKELSLKVLKIKKEQQLKREKTLYENLKKKFEGD